eukprot:GSChrysophyteH1.ASY1.ANO1.1221.1 assembled CDS
MGGHMAHNLLKAGCQVTVFDIAVAPVDTAKSHGAIGADTPAAVAANSDVCITMLPSNPHVEECYMGTDGLLSSANANTLFIDSSTVDPAISRKVSAACIEHACAMVDAPVSGAQEDFERCQPILNIMGSNIVHCGGVGTGEIAKLCNNLVLGISMAGVCEAMALGNELGIDTKVLADIMNTSTARCWSSDTYNPCPGVMEGVPSSRGYTGGFGSALMQKDLGLALDAARSTGVPSPMGSNAFQLYSLMSAHGAGHKDFSALFEFLYGRHNK